ncbi:MAG: hypothetical protein Q4B26_13310 [Eubacteriales bacterium]|nr:hypothetical protein [Eubacteriales bacterium]
MGCTLYTATFTVPEDWDSENGRMEFEAESFCDGTAAVWINGEKVSVNMDRGTADIGAYVKTGENTIEVRVTSSLLNVMKTQEYDGWAFGAPDADDYGMVGETVICMMSDK